MNRILVPYAERAEHVHFLGPWVAGTIYKLGQSVENDGGKFTCILGHVASAANEPIPDVDARIIATAIAFNETPTGTKNGSNPIFTLEHTPIGGIQLAYGGLTMSPGAGNDYTLSGDTITTISFFPEVGVNFLALYAY
jgi:hypothetical protein